VANKSNVALPVLSDKGKNELSDKTVGSPMAILLRLLSVFDNAYMFAF
jgi:hypothetical protein